MQELTSAVALRANKSNPPPNYNYMIGPGGPPPPPSCNPQ